MLSSRSILALMLVALLAVPALAAGGKGTGDGSGKDNSSGAATTSGDNNSKAEKKPTKIPKDDKVAREAVKKNQVLSLESVTALVGKASTGRVLDVQLVSLDGVYVYEITLLEVDGRLHKLYFNARSGASVDAL